MKKILMVLTVIIILMLSVFNSSCSNSSPAYKFPLSQTDIEEVIKIQKLPYHLEDSQSFSESHVVYTLKTDEKATIFIETNGLEGERALIITWALPHDFKDEQLKAFHDVELPRLFELMTVLYGNRKEARKPSKDFIDYAKNIDISKDRGIYWSFRSGDHHYKFKMPQWSTKPTDSNIGSLSVMNSKAYEKDLISRGKVIRESAKSQNSEVLETTVEDIMKTEAGGKYPNDRVQLIIVKGNVSEIIKPKSPPKLLTLMSDNLESDKDSFIRGKLNDSTGSIEIYIQPTSLTDEELKQERSHYLARISPVKGEYIYVLTLSASIE